MLRAVLLLLLLSIPADAHAWRQTMTCLLEEPPAPTATPFCTGNEFPKPLAWPTRTVTYQVNEAGSTQFPSDDGVISPALLETIQASFETWNEPGCSDFEFVYDGLTSIDEFDRSDGINVVVFQDENWPYGETALAITTVTAAPDGTITNADMELNSANQQFGFVTGDSTDWDVQNTITHEAGHILGLDHDDVRDSTMEFEAARGETKKRDLHPDDVEGLCTIHPSGERLEEMEPDPKIEDDGCCATTRPNDRGALAALFLVFAAAAARRKKQRHEQ